MQKISEVEIDVFARCQQLLKNLNLPIVVKDAPQQLSFPLASLEIMEYFPKLNDALEGIISFSKRSIGDDMTSPWLVKVKSVDAGKLQQLSMVRLSKFTPFISQLPPITINQLKQHPAFIDNYTMMHSRILKTCPIGSYAIYHEATYLIVVGFFANDDGSHGINFLKATILQNGKIQQQDLCYDSVNELLHDNNYFGKHEWTKVTKYNLGQPLADIIARSEELKNKIVSYHRNCNDPEINSICDFLAHPLDGRKVRYEHRAFISAAIDELTSNAEKKCSILEALISGLTAATNGTFHNPINFAENGCYHNFLTTEMENTLVSENSDQIKSYLDRIENMGIFEKIEKVKIVPLESEQTTEENADSSAQSSYSSFTM